MGNTYPTPATRDGIERVRTYPVTPPTMHSVPMTNAVIADCRRVVKVCGEGEKGMSLALEQTLSNGNPGAPFSECLKAFEDKEM